MGWDTTSSHGAKGGQSFKRTREKKEFDIKTAYDHWREMMDELYGVKDDGSKPSYS